MTVQIISAGNQFNFVLVVDDFLDVEDFQVERALQHAALDAMDRAQRCGTGFVVWEKAAVKILEPDETGEYRQRATQNLDRINQKISELQKNSAESFALNDRPPTK